MLSKLAPLIITYNLWITDILMVTHAPRDGVGWGQEIGQCFELQNVSFSMHRKVDVHQTCIIKISLDTPRGGVKK